ncbi:MAG: quinolinate synthetase [Desulfobulbaceae bacterium DB1]|nr:MAG: quinolinate synthetase [Desulfobulbaceae bacterium DB1]
MTEQQSILFDKIRTRKKELRGKVLLLAHHYQNESVYQFADLTGDSLKLARQAAEAGSYPYIVFCGVHFMAESADILTGPDQAVILPDLRAGCPMADMATVEGVEEAWRELSEICDMKKVIPVTYVNSSARIKSFVGTKGGSVCTSSNAERVLRWALRQGEKVFFFPDEHLGRNSSKALGMSDGEIALWQRGKKLGGNSVEQLKKAKTILWNGYCHVHQEFAVQQLVELRREYPGIKIIVHPESPFDVVHAADYYGSTERIIEAVQESAPGTIWAIGTEVNLVNRLKMQHPDKTILLPAPSPCTCGTMSRITPENLLWVLDNLAEGKVVNQIKVDRRTAEGAKLALDRMLEI